MNPLPTPPADPSAAGPPAAGDPLVEFVRTQRQTAAYVLLGLSVVFLVATVLLAVRGFRSDGPADKTKDKDKAATSPLDPDAPKPEITDPKRTDYMVGWIGTATGFLITAVGGAVLLAGMPKPTAEAQRAEARALILVVGGLLGLFLILFGGWYFYLWSDSLGNWLDKGEAREMRWVVIPLLMVVAGAGLVFAAVQPARAEERNNQTLRRLVYGSNLGLTVLLLFVFLVIVNVVVARKVPSKLDTTETGFYSLSDPTKAILGRLSEPVTAYVIAPDSGTRDVNDMRQLMYSAQDASNGRFTARFVSPVTDKTELERLQRKYARVDRNALGVLVTVGDENSTRHAFIPYNDLFKTEPAGRAGGSGQESFVGESALVRELRFLAENEQKPVVYFTQANGELSIGAAGGEGVLPLKDASQLRSFLDRNNLDVKSLDLAAANPAVPADAAVVVVADPQTPLGADAAKALREYMTGPRKGKMIVLAGTDVSVAAKGVAKTGLEDLLTEFNVRLGDQIVYSFPTQRIAPELTLAEFAAAAEQNPISQAISPRVPQLPVYLPREVAPLTAKPEYRATSLLVTLRGRSTWLEADTLDDSVQTALDLRGNEAMRARKVFTAQPRSVAVTVAEAGGGPHGGGGGAARLVVMGNAVIFSNRLSSQLFGGRGSPPTYDLVSASIDWLRDRPVSVPGIESKVYKEYTFPQPEAVDSTRLLWFPLGLALLSVAGLGAGVWVMRRK